jgi:hypothetical protein
MNPVDCFLDDHWEPHVDSAIPRTALPRIGSHESIRAFSTYLNALFQMKEGLDVYSDSTVVLIWRLSDSRALRDLLGAPLFGTLAKTDRPLGTAVGILQV